jgi:DNA-nicking Smr family endonuclease
MPDDPDRVSDITFVPLEAELDLHAFAPQDVTSVVDEYVTAAAHAGFREVRIVHGRGRGVQRGFVQAALDRHPLVEAFRDDTASHLGATLVQLRKDLSLAR